MSLDAYEKIEEEIQSWWESKLDRPGNLPALTADIQKDLYRIAYDLYQKRQYKRAIPFFHALTLAAPFEADNWKGLGACYQMEHHYEKAIQNYICAQLQHKDKPDPYIYVYAADCYFALNQIEQGLKALEGAKAVAEKQKDTRILRHVALMSTLWNNNKKTEANGRGE